MNNELIRLERAMRQAPNAESRNEALCRFAESLAGHDPRRARELAGEALEIARRNGYRRHEAYALAILGPLEADRSQEGAGLLEVEEARRIAGEIDDEEILCRALLAEAHVRIGLRETDLALASVEQALRIAREAEEKGVETDAILLLGRVQTLRFEYDRARSAFRRAERIIPPEGDERRRMKLGLYSGMLASRQSDVTTSIPMLSEALERARAIGDRVVECYALLALGRAVGSTGDFSRALQYYMSVPDLANSLELFRVELDALLDIALVHKRYGDTALAKSMAERVLAMARDSGKRSSEAWALEFLGTIAYHADDLDEGLRLFRACAALSEETGIQDLAGISQQNIGDILRDRGEFDRALEHYALALSIARPIGDLYSIASTTYSIGLVHYDRSEHSKAIEVFTDCMEQCERIQTTPLLYSCHNVLADLYEQRAFDGDTALALQHLKKAVELNEQLMSAERQRQIAEMHTRAAREQAEREREREIARSERLALEAQHRAEELTALGVHLAEHADLIASFRRDLRRALEAGGDERESILWTLLKTVDERGENEQEWTGFEEKLQSVHHGVLVELARLCPDLKPAELKVCALLRTQLSTKEIAALLSVTERAVEKHRFNVRRKLKLSKEDNLVAFLTRIGGSPAAGISAAA